MRADDLLPLADSIGNPSGIGSEVALGTGRRRKELALPAALKLTGLVANNEAKLR